MKKKVINVTKPYLPPIEEFMPLLEDIWQSKMLTNNGKYNTKFCRELEKLWGVKHVVTFTNGTQALLAALSCLISDKKGEVITTPFTFIATTNAIIWTGHKPVFVDIDPENLNIDVSEIEKAITSETVAILAVHCYGNPCEVSGLKKLSKRHGIPLVYDAAHAFGVECNGQSVFQFGDMSVASFHATKTFNTFEGGAVACHSAVLRDKLINFANFGFQNETTISSLGLNAKMSEFNAALGLVQLKHIDNMFLGRKTIANYYVKELSSLKGVFIPTEPVDTQVNYSYFPIFVQQDAKTDRDTLYSFLREHGFMVRRYFYPLTCDFGIREIEETALRHDLSQSTKCAEEVLCLPIYPDLELTSIYELVTLLKSKLS
ncbi:DegT/DnrJ/EryC1/StrS family aminotransferase [Aliiglaciecola sp. 2_MG-2023]|uniref:DegT/DnrJ/EryC1/StrS family aminotransferase n=1 Tax=unclassified Aliiglaciecola TaxID=2593648 RepID=UPI0026E1E150|nr:MULTISPECIES: DegT/DnrJ/EryC1/StrS family aminotransferase [unclassified Aliiglaciecola]MDO6709117.1 DegT/DnrJ/EryC1/StrS family aminotransferase [Aliiglaciecola sp. 2_MG-2023]MDO6750265.1 DegT/DnrJ/EryC1/StrS family aminotransferase [Aliiglaciecola sp. 1_MG-2023]